MIIVQENIPENSTHDSLTSLFSVYGPVSYVSIPKFNNTKRSIKGFAFVEFATSDAAHKACDALKGGRGAGFEAVSKLIETTWQGPKVVPVESSEKPSLTAIMKEEWMQLKSEYKARQRHAISEYKRSLPYPPPLRGPPLSSSSSQSQSLNDLPSHLHHASNKKNKTNHSAPTQTQDEAQSLSSNLVSSTPPPPPPPPLLVLASSPKQHEEDSNHQANNSKEEGVKQDGQQQPLKENLSNSIARKEKKVKETSAEGYTKALVVKLELSPSIPHGDVRAFAKSFGPVVFLDHKDNSSEATIRFKKSVHAQNCASYEVGASLTPLVLSATLLQGEEEERYWTAMRANKASKNNEGILSESTLAPLPLDTNPPLPAAQAHSKEPNTSAIDDKSSMTSPAPPSIAEPPPQAKEKKTKKSAKKKRQHLHFEELVVENKDEGEEEGLGKKEVTTNTNEQTCVAIDLSSPDPTQTSTTKLKRKRESLSGEQGKKRSKEDP